MVSYALNIERREKERIHCRDFQRKKRKLESFEKREMGNIGGEIEEIEKMIPRMLSFSATGKTKTTATATMPVLSLNHVSFICKSAEKSVKFYEEVLGFVVIKRPSSFNFQGAWYAPLHYLSCPFPVLLYLLLLDLFFIFFLFNLLIVYLF